MFHAPLPPLPALPPAAPACPAAGSSSALLPLLALPCFLLFPFCFSLIRSPLFLFVFFLSVLSFRLSGSEPRGDRPPPSPVFVLWSVFFYGSRRADPLPGFCPAAFSGWAVRDADPLRWLCLLRCLAYFAFAFLFFVCVYLSRCGCPVCGLPSI